MGENIGTTARAMLNCGVTELRLVNPRDGWPSERAEATAAGALSLMPDVQVFSSTADAIADCHTVYATTARLRDLEIPAMSSRQAASDIVSKASQGLKSAVLFGPERAGLTNDDVCLAQNVINIPLNPEFSSLNLAQAVMVVCYDWSQHDEPQIDHEIDAPAPHELRQELFERLENELEKHHFFRTDETKPYMVRNLRAMLTRAQMTEQEIRTFHGVISALIGQKAPKGK